MVFEQTALLEIIALDLKDLSVLKVAVHDFENRLG